MTEMGIDLLAFTGHKGLQGPPGTGGLILADNFDPAQLQPLVRGGTGSRSEFERQPDDLPDRYESGTPNGVGIAGLGAGIAWVKEKAWKRYASTRSVDARTEAARLAGIPGVRLFGPDDPELTTAVLSFTLEETRLRNRLPAGRGSLASCAGWDCTAPPPRTARLARSAKARCGWPPAR